MPETSRQWWSTSRRPRNRPSENDWPHTLRERRTTDEQNTHDAGALRPDSVTVIPKARTSPTSLPRSVNRSTFNPGPVPPRHTWLGRRHRWAALPETQVGAGSVVRALIVGVGLVLFSLFAVAPAQAQDGALCTRVLDTAAEQYLEGAYGEAMRFVSSCLNQAVVPDSQAVAAYRLLALIHLKQDELDSARAAVVNLLGLQPDYTADPVANPPSYVSLVSLVRRDLEGAQQAAVDASDRPPFFRRTSTWLTMTSILVGSGVATYFVVEGNGGSGGGGPPDQPPLPAPPSVPPN